MHQHFRPRNKKQQQKKKLNSYESKSNGIDQELKSIRKVEVQRFLYPFCDSNNEYERRSGTLQGLINL